MRERERGVQKAGNSERRALARVTKILKLLVPRKQTLKTTKDVSSKSSPFHPLKILIGLSTTACNTLIA